MKQTAEEYLMKYGIGSDTTIDVGEGDISLTELIENYANQSKWISVEDRLPEDDKNYSTPCLVVCSSYGIVVRPFNHFHNCWDDEDGDDHYSDPIGGKITKWQPLPTK